MRALCGAIITAGALIGLGLTASELGRIGQHQQIGITVRQTSDPDRGFHHLSDAFGIQAIGGRARRPAVR